MQTVDYGLADPRYSHSLKEMHMFITNRQIHILRNGRRVGACVANFILKRSIVN